MCTHTHQLMCWFSMSGCIYLCCVHTHQLMCWFSMSGCIYLCCVHTHQLMCWFSMSGCIYLCCVHTPTNVLVLNEWLYTYITVCVVCTSSHRSTATPSTGWVRRRLTHKRGIGQRRTCVAAGTSLVYRWAPIRWPVSRA